MPKSKTRLAILLLLILAATKLLILAYTVGRGFEMTDEGYYLLWFHSAHLYAPDMHLNYYYLVQLFFGWVKWDITAMRIGGIVTEVGAVLALGWGVRNYLKAKLPQLYSPALLAMLLLGGFMSIFTAEHPRSLSYDSVTHLLMAMGTGMLLTWQARSTRPKNAQLLVFFMMLGVLLASQFIVKFSSAILLAGLWLLVSVVWPRPIKATVIGIAGTVAGIAILLVALFGTQISLAQFMEYYRISYERIALLGYSPVDIVLKTYLAKDTFHFMINIGPALGAIFAALWGLQSLAPAKRITWAMGIGIAVFVGQAILLPTHYFPQWHYRFVDALLLLMVSGSFILWRYAQAGAQVWLLLLVLFAMPFVCAIGSAINWAMSLFSYLPAWLMLVIVLWAYIKQQIGTKIVSTVVPLAVTVGSYIIFLQVFLYPNYLPHGMAAPMQQQTEQPLAYDPVKLDGPTATFVKQTEMLLTANGYQPGNYLLALYDLPGLVYLLQGYSPQVPWYFGETTRATVKEAVDNTCWHVSEITDTNVFVIKPLALHPEVVQCLSASKLRFPDRYLLAGKVYNPYCKCEMEVWAPQK